MSSIGIGGNSQAIEQMASYLDEVNAQQQTSTAAGKDFIGVPYDINLTQSKYDFSNRVFPSDLGEQSYNGHYMVININVQNGTRFSGSITSDIGRSVNTFQTLSQELSKVDALKQNIDNRWKDSSGNSLQTAFTLPRQTRRIVESIALYMPNTVVFDTNNDYEDVGLTDIGKGMVQTATGFVSNSLSKGVGKMVDKVLDAGGHLIDKGSKFAQRPINPRVEVLFRNTLQRTFQYDFLFAPESPEDTIAMKQIIQTLRFHAAPEYQNGSGAFMYIPPSEFDITFYNRGKENLNIPRINTCALTKINIDYAPQGVYSTFTNGAPVSCRMQLEFRELEVISKLRVLQGF